MRTRFDSAHRLTLVFLAVLVPAAATLVWLGLRLLEQDRALWTQRDFERQEAAADAVVRSLAQVLAEAQRRLPGRSESSALRTRAFRHRDSSRSMSSPHG